jgi:hypothetical protein
MGLFRIGDPTMAKFGQQIATRGSLALRNYMH